MLVCKNCGAKIADHSKKCYACGTEVTPETAEEFHREGAEEESASPFSAAREGIQRHGANAREEIQKHGENARNIWQERYGAGKENSEKLEPGDPRIPRDENDPWGIGSFGDEDDEELQELKAAILRMEEEQKKAYTAPTDEMLYIGSGSFPILMKFHRLRDKNKIISWNWWAFLIGPFWFIYRKMYGMGAIMLAISVWISLFFDVSTYYYAVTIAIDVLMGLFADALYMNHIEKLVEKGQKLSKEERGRHIKRWGGTSLAGVLIVMLVYEILTSAILYLL